MLTLDKEVYEMLKHTAPQRGVSVQELMRAVIVPDWLVESDKPERRKRVR